jgi:hypothetical protein
MIKEILNDALKIPLIIDKNECIDYVQVNVL